METQHTLLLQVVEKIHAQQLDISNLSFIFPTSHVAYTFRQILGKTLKKTQWAPKSYSLPNFMQSLYAHTIATRWKLLTHLYKIVAPLEESFVSFPNFHQWGSHFLQDIESIAQYQLPIETLLTKKTTAIQNKLPSIHSPETWAKIYKDFHDALAQNQLTYTGYHYQKIDELLQAGKLDVMHKHVILIGIHPLTPLVTHLLQTLSKTTKIDYYIDADAYYMESSHQEASRQLRLYQKDPLLGKYLQPPLPSNITAKTTIEIFNTSTRFTQIQTVATELKKLSAQPSFQAENVTIALADPSLCIPLLHALPHYPLSIYIDYPFYQTPLCTLLHTVVDWYASQQDSYHKQLNINNVYHKLMHHAYISLPSDITTKTNPCSPVSTLKKQENLPLVWQYLLHVDPGVSIIAYLEKFLHMLKDNPPANSSWQSWEKLAMDAAIDGCKKLSHTPFASLCTLTQDWVLLLKKELKHIKLPLHAKNNKGISIVSLQGTVALHFTYLFVLSLNEKIFPKAHIHTSLPASCHGLLPDKEIQKTKDAYLFYRWLHSAKKCYFFYYERDKGNQIVAPSSFLQQLQYESPCTIIHHSYLPSITPIQVKPISIVKNASVLKKLQQFIGESPQKTLTPTAINTYLDCKLRFYFKYIAKLPPAPLPDEIQIAGFLGRILHESMQLIYDPYIGKTVTEKNIHYLQKHVEDSVLLAIEKQDVQSITRYKNRLLHIRKIVIKLIAQLLSLDKKKAPFTLLHVEENLQKPFLLPDGKVVTLSGIVDRIDKKNNIIHVIDYKTNAVNTKIEGLTSLFDRTKKMRNTTALQLIWYAWLYTQDKEAKHIPIQPTFISTKNIFKANPPTCFSLLNKEKKYDVFTSVHGYTDLFEKEMTALLLDLFNPATPFDQTEMVAHCRNCPYKKICQRF